MPRVLLARAMDPRHVAQIQSVSVDVDVIYEPALVPPVAPRERHFYEPGVLDEALPGEHRWPRDEDDQARWEELHAGADVLFDLDWSCAHVIPVATPELRWIQTMGAGVSVFFDLLPGLRESPIELIAAHGVHSAALGDFALAAILHHTKRFARLATNQSARRWQEFAGVDVGMQRACVVGTGSIGTAVGSRLRAVGMEVVGVATARRDATATPFSEIAGVDELLDMLGACDHVVITLPGSARTHHLFDATALAAMRPGAFLVNVGRGPVVDETALIAALDRGHLGGAALDVFEQEPLPPDSPLWSFPNVIVSPHATALMPSGMQRIVDLFCENLRRERAGAPLLYVVDKRSDY